MADCEPCKNLPCTNPDDFRVYSTDGFPPQPLPPVPPSPPQPFSNDAVQYCCNCD